MEQMNAKLKKQGGFTLIEMLIVVAIIAILVAISIPMVNSNLEKARDATDTANERAAKTLALLYYTGVAENEISGTPGDLSEGYLPGMAMLDSSNIYFDAEEGTLTYTLPKGYGQCTGCGKFVHMPEGTYEKHVGQVIQVLLTEDGVFTAQWVNGRSSDPEDDPNYDPWGGI